LNIKTIGSFEASHLMDITGGAKSSLLQDHKRGERGHEANATAAAAAASASASAAAAAAATTSGSVSPK
jgi:hypothetical protein